MAKNKKTKKDKKSASAASKGAKRLSTLAQNPIVADVVAAALVATASALKDPKRARALASDAGDELRKLSKEGAEAGNAFWDLAVQIGRRSLDALTGDGAKKSKKKSKGAAKPAKAKPAARAKPAAKRKPAARASAAKRARR